MTPRPVEAVDEGTSLLTGATTGARDDVGPGRTYRASSSSSSSSSSSTPIAIRDDDERGIRDDDRRIALHLFLEARTPHGLLYEKFIIFLILLSVITFVLSSVYVSEYNVDSDLPSRCDAVCDALWFGNNNDNALSFLNIGSTSLVEIIVVFIFTIDYVLRMYVADMEDPKYAGINGRLLHYVPSFYSIVDLSSILPFYVDSFVLTKSDISSSNYLRMFRLLRMMKVEGRYDMAMTMIDDALYGQRGILGTALFVGVTVWGVLSSFFYIVERENPNMIYCGAATGSGCDDVDATMCVTDEWGMVDCTDAGCFGEDDDRGAEVCWNLYRSIVSSGYWTLIELFGEFPLIDQHSPMGRVLGTFTAVIAVAVFALPVGVLASGLEDQIARRREARRTAAPPLLDHGDGGEGDGNGDFGGMAAEAGDVVIGDVSTFRGRAYDLLHCRSSPSAVLFVQFTRVLIIGCAIAFVVDSTVDSNGKAHAFLGGFQFFSFVVFAVEYFLRMYSAGVDAKFGGIRGLGGHALEFLRIIDVLSIAPYFIGRVFLPDSTAPAFFLLLKVFHFERCSDSFTTFDDIIRENLDVLSVTGFSAVLLWIFFSSMLYFTERDNPDEDMRGYYSTIPNSMWITLLNLTGECPLAHYSAFGKVLQGIIGLFATAIFGIPIGILGAGFEELITRKYEETSNDEAALDQPVQNRTSFADFQLLCYQFVNGIGSVAATTFEISIYFLIGATVTIGVVQTVPGYENYGGRIEWLAVIVFTIEYMLRLVGAAVDPVFSTGSNVFTMLKYVFSFYSIVDLLAILPFYYAYAYPNSWINAHDEYLRMLRLIRLLKLEKYVPSISLLDDVVRLKREILAVAGYAALTMWFLFTGAMYVSERNDHAMAVDPLPLYGCVEGCFMADRYKTFFTSLPLTGIHLTGDFPLVQYGGMGRVILFFAVLAAVGVVAIPSGVIASGFAEIVESKTKSKEKGTSVNAGDDWFDIQYRQLEGCPPPPSPLGHNVDALQIIVKEFLDGKVDESTGEVSRSQLSRIGRALFFSLIVANVFAVILESVPEIDKAVGNSAGNFFDVFEAWSVLFFTIDYMLRLFSARKSRDALYSPWMYARTFFGIVDLITIAPWYIHLVLVWTCVNVSNDQAKIFRIVRVFRLLQLEDFLIAFSKLDNVFRATKDILKATCLMAIIIWVGTSALFFIFEQDNPNFRECDASVPLLGTKKEPGCYDFESTAACNAFYPDMCSQTAFANMPDTMYYVAVFLGGEWGVVDFTWQGKCVCMVLCIAGIALYSIPVGALFDSFGAVIGLNDEEDEEEEEDVLGSIPKM